MDKHLQEALKYVRENKNWSSAEEAVALERIDKMRCDIEQASPEISDNIAELMNEYGEGEDLEEDWWREFGDEDDIFFMLDEAEDDSEFLEKQSKVMSNSVSYTKSSAFQRAMSYVADNDWNLYKELIELEYSEAFE